jgi:hypothetical protein
VWSFLSRTFEILVCFGVGIVFRKTATNNFVSGSKKNNVLNRVGLVHGRKLQLRPSDGVFGDFFLRFFFCPTCVFEVLPRVVSRWYRQFFRYRYFAGIRFVGFSVFRLVSIPPFFVYFPPFLPPFFPKGGRASQKGGHCPPFEEKGGHCPLFYTEMYRPSFPSVSVW